MKEKTTLKGKTFDVLYEKLKKAGCKWSPDTGWCEPNGDQVTYHWDDVNQVWLVQF